MNALSPSVYGVVMGADVILLDVGADRYHALVGAAAVDGGPWHEGAVVPDLAPEAVAALFDAGLMTPGPGRAFSEIRGPGRVLTIPPAVDGTRPRLRDVLDLAAAMVTAWWRLRRGLPCRSHHSARRSVAEATRAEAEAAIKALRRIRLFVPTPRRCLPASLIASVFLARRGVQSELLFGVRSHPFEAHCWVEHGGVVLDDDLAKVSAYRPMMVGRP